MSTSETTKLGVKSQGESMENACHEETEISISPQGVEERNSEPHFSEKCTPHMQPLEKKDVNSTLIEKNCHSELKDETFAQPYTVVADSVIVDKDVLELGGIILEPISDDSLSLEDISEDEEGQIETKNLPMGYSTLLLRNKELEMQKTESLPNRGADINAPSALNVEEELKTKSIRFNDDLMELPQETEDRFIEQNQEDSTVLVHDHCSFDHTLDHMHADIDNKNVRETNKTLSVMSPLDNKNAEEDLPLRQVCVEKRDYVEDPGRANMEHTPTFSNIVLSDIFSKDVQQISPDGHGETIDPLEELLMEKELGCVGKSPGSLPKPDNEKNDTEEISKQEHVIEEANSSLATALDSKDEDLVIQAKEKLEDFVSEKDCLSSLDNPDLEELIVIDKPSGIKQNLEEEESAELTQTELTVPDRDFEGANVDDITVVDEVKTSSLGMEDIVSDEEHKEEAIVEIFIKENGEAFTKCGGHIETLDPVHGEDPESLLDETGIDTIIVEEKGEEHVDVQVSALESEKNECMTVAPHLDPKCKDPCNLDTVVEVVDIDSTKDLGLDTMADISKLLQDKSSLGKDDDIKTKGPAKFVPNVETDVAALPEECEEGSNGNEHQGEKLQISEVLTASSSKELEADIVDVVSISTSDTLNEELKPEDVKMKSEEEEEEVTITGVCEPESSKDGLGMETKGVEATTTVITGLSNCSRSLQSDSLACAAVSAKKTHVQAIETANHLRVAESDLRPMRTNGIHFPPALTTGHCHSPPVWHREDHQDSRREKGKIFLGFLPGESQRDRQLRLASVRLGKSTDEACKTEDIDLPFWNLSSDLEDDCLSLKLAEPQVATKSESTATRDHVTVELPVLEQALGSDGVGQATSDRSVPEEPVVVLPSDYFEAKPCRSSRRRSCRGKKLGPNGRYRSHVKASEREKKDVHSEMQATEALVETRTNWSHPSIIQSPDLALAKTLHECDVEPFDRYLSRHNEKVDDVSNSAVLIISECSEASSEDAFLYPGDRELSDTHTYQLVVCDADDSLGRSDEWYVEDQILEQENESEILERIEKVKRQFRQDFTFMETRERTKLKKDLAGLMLKIGFNSNTVLDSKDAHCPSELRDVLESTRGCNVNLRYEIQKLERQREYARERTRRKRRNMSEEAKAMNRSKERERVKLKRAVMSEQQKCVYRARERERARLKRALMSQDKREEERRKSRERMRDFRESLTEEEKLARREMCRVRMRQYRERLYADPDKATELKKKNRERQRQSRMQKKINDLGERRIDEEIASYTHA